MALFEKLYDHYKDDWDFEMRLKNANMTYKEAYVKSQKSQEWF